MSRQNVKEYEIVYGRKVKLPSMISSDKRLLAMMSSPMTTSTTQPVCKLDNQRIKYDHPFVPDFTIHHWPTYNTIHQFNV